MGGCAGSLKPGRCQAVGKSSRSGEVHVTARAGLGFPGPIRRPGAVWFSGSWASRHHWNAAEELRTEWESEGLDIAQDQGRKGIGWSSGIVLGLPVEAAGSVVAPLGTEGAFLFRLDGSSIGKVLLCGSPWPIPMMNGFSI